VIQAISQSLTYPLVAAIVSHGANGVVDLAAFAQGQAVMFVIGAFGGGLITTGMVFGRDIEGFNAFRRLNQILCVTLVAVRRWSVSRLSTTSFSDWCLVWPNRSLMLLGMS